MRRESVLIERLDDVALLRERLPQPVAEHDLAISQVAHDLAGAPLTGRRWLFAARRPEFRRQVLQAACGRRDHFNRITVAEERGIGIHGEKITHSEFPIR